MAAIKFLASFFIPLIIFITIIAALNRPNADLISLGYLVISVVFSTRYRDFRLNLCIWTDRLPSRTNIELFRILPLYVYGVLACKLLYQVPYFYPYLFGGGLASVGTCTPGTAGCDTWMDFLGVLKLDKACDPTMMQECSRVMSWERGGILPEILLFVMCAVQQNLFQYDKYNDTVWDRQKRSVVRSEKATMLHVKRMIDWRNSAVEHR